MRDLTRLDFTYIFVSPIVIVLRLSSCYRKIYLQILQFFFSHEKVRVYTLAVIQLIYLYLYSSIGLIRITSSGSARDSGKNIADIPVLFPRRIYCYEKE